MLPSCGESSAGSIANAKGFCVAFYTRVYYRLGGLTTSMSFGVYLGVSFASLRTLRVSELVMSPYTLRLREAPMNTVLVAARPRRGV